MPTKKQAPVRSIPIPDRLVAQFTGNPRLKEGGLNGTRRFDLGLFKEVIAATLNDATFQQSMAKVLAKQSR